MAEIKGQLRTHLEHKSGAEDGSFTGVLSTYGNIDEVGDICEAGCFDRSIEVSGTTRPLLWQHNPEEPIGHFEIMSTEGALTISGKFNLDTQRGREAYSLLRNGDIDGLSIGYRATDYTYDQDGIRHLKEVDLLEGSFVTFPANVLARAQAKSRRLARMSKFAEMKFLTKMSEEDRAAALAELDALEEEEQDGKSDNKPDDNEDPKKEEGEDKSSCDDDDDPDETTEDDDVMEFIRDLRKGCDRILKN